MDLNILRRNPNTALIAKTVVSFSRTGSTNADATEMAERGAPEGTVVVADFQEAGRGRRGRQWIANPGDCLLCSVVLRPHIAPREVFYLTMVPALAVLDTLGQFGVGNTGLKWPNDVQISGRKVAGILTELSLRGTTLDYVVAGVGLDVNLDVSKYGEIADIATSMRSELGTKLAVEDVALALWQSFERHYLMVEAGQGGLVFAEWRQKLTTVGQTVNVHDASGVYRAMASDVTTDGGLVLLRDGQRIVVYGEEVTLAKDD